MTTYLDTSVIVSMFTVDVHSDRANRMIIDAERLVVSDLTGAEFASALAIHHRSGRATEADVRTAFAMFDAWCETMPDRVEISSSDIRGAQALIRQLEHPLRAPDATHLMLTRRLGLSLATFDSVMARAAPRLGVQLLPI